ncbi:MAG: hypothetical protein R2815_06280 [Flavobacteriales bacterium]
MRHFHLLKTKTRTCLLGLIMLPVAVLAQAEYELVWDSVSTVPWPPMVLGMVGKASGGQLLITRGPGIGDMDVYSYDDLGNPIWSRRVTPVSPFASWFASVSDGAEGLITVSGELTTPAITKTNVEVTRMDGSGNVLWGRQLFFDATPIGNNIMTNSFLLSDTDGSVDVFIPFSETGSLRWWVWRLDANGNTVRVRSFGEDLYLGFPDIDEELNHFWRADRTPDGGYVISGVTGSPPSLIFIGRADVNGEMLWLNTYRILGTGIDDFQNLVAHADGTFEASGRFLTTNGPQFIRVEIGAGGAITQADAYATPFDILSWGAHPTPNGGSVSLISLPKVFELDANGDVVAATRGFNTQVPPSNVGQDWVGTSVVNGRLLAGGLVRSTPIDFGPSYFRPFIGAYSIGASLEGCQHEPIDVQRQPIPLSATEVTPRTLVQMDLMAYATTVAVTPVATPLPNPVMVEFCNLLVGTEEISAPPGLSVVGNPIRTGDALVLRDVSPGTLHVVSSTGAMVKAERLNASHTSYTLDLPAMSQGIYLLAWQSLDGATRHTVPFMVE